MRYDAIVLGAGVAGLSAARCLVERGLRRVLVIERGLISHAGATPRAAGAVFSGGWQAESQRLALRTQAILADLAGRTGPAFIYRRTGYLLVVSAIQRPFMDFIVQSLRAQGVRDLEVLSPAELAARFPGLRTDDVDGGYYNPGDAVVHPLQLGTALAGIARAAGVDILEGAPADRLALSDGRVTGVVVRGDTFGADRVVLAAGLGSRRLLRASGLDIPLKPFRTQVSVVPTPADLALPGLTDATLGMYGCPRVAGGYLFGYGTQTEDVPETGWRPEQDEDEEAAALERFWHRVPALAGVRPAGGWAGICDIAPDSEPLLGPYRVPGLYALCGLAGHGLNRGPAAAEVVADLAAGREPALDVTAYHAARYDDYAGEDWPVTFGGPWRISVAKKA